MLAVLHLHLWWRYFQINYGSVRGELKYLYSSLLIKILRWGKHLIFIIYVLGMIMKKKQKVCSPSSICIYRSCRISWFQEWFYICPLWGSCAKSLTCETFVFMEDRTLARGKVKASNQMREKKSSTERKESGDNLRKRKEKYELKKLRVFWKFCK